MPASRTPRLVAGALLALFAAAGCGAGSGTIGGGTTDTAGTDPAEPTEPELATAADGTDYAACDDGSCEIVLSEPLELDFGEFAMTISPAADGIEYEKTSDNGSGSGSMGGDYCISYITVNGGSTSCYAVAEGGPPAAPEPESGVLVLELLDFADGTAVIRLTSG